MPKPLTLPQKLDRFPPVVIRLLARERRPDGSVRALTTFDIATRSGLTRSEVAHLSRLTSWGDVSIEVMLAFVKGCGADLDNRDWLRKNAAYMASIRSIPRYLLKSPEWSGVFESLIRIWVSHDKAA
jgi:hypothetical protein